MFQSDLQTDMAFGQNLPESAPVCQYHIAAHLSIAKGPAFGLEPWTAELSGADRNPAELPYVTFTIRLARQPRRVI